MSDPSEAFGFHLAGAALADGSDAELRELGEQVALGLLGTSSAAEGALGGAVEHARRVLYDAELPTPEFTSCLARLEGLRARVAEQLPALAELTAAQIEARLRDGPVRDASYAMTWHGGLPSFSRRAGKGKARFGGP